MEDYTFVADCETLEAEFKERFQAAVGKLNSESQVFRIRKELDRFRTATGIQTGSPQLIHPNAPQKAPFR